MPANSFNIASESDLNTALAAISGGTGSYTFTYNQGFQLTSALNVVRLGNGGALSILGGGFAMNGQNSFGGFVVIPVNATPGSSSVSIANLNIVNMRQVGGVGADNTGGGGGGGGGAGLGGGLFVGAGTNATLTNVGFTGDQAIGGGGGAGNFSGAHSGQGGAMGGSGGLAGYQGGAGGQGLIGSQANGGSGGFGAGGGGGDPGGGSAFGGGRGGSTSGTEASGGLGAGGAIFVQSGATLAITGNETISGGGVGGGAVGSGTNGSGGASGAALGTGIFLDGNQTLTYAPTSGATDTVSDVIAGDATITVIVNGAGTLALSGANTFAGGIQILAGTLRLANAAAAGTGSIAFGANAAATLALAPGVSGANTVVGFSALDTIDFQGLGGNATVTLGAGNLLSAHGSNGTRTVQLDPGASYAGAVFSAVSDGAGGANVSYGQASAGPTAAIPSYQVGTGLVGNQTNFSGSLGYDFTTSRTIVISSLGAFDSGQDGLSRPITVRLYNTATGLLVDGLQVTISGAQGTLIGSTRSVTLAAPVSLQAGSYSIVASGYGPGEPDFNLLQGATTLLSQNTDAGSMAFVGTSRYGTAADQFPTNLDSHVANYAAGSFQYAALIASNAELATFTQAVTGGTAGTPYAANLTAGVAVTAAAGANGANGTPNDGSSNSVGPDQGHVGADGLTTTTNESIASLAAFIGGAGGKGGDGSGNNYADSQTAQGADGGQGGAGDNQSQGGTVTNGTNLTGGAGGTGGAFSSYSQGGQNFYTNPGRGGHGGAGAIVGPGGTLVNTGFIAGGVGGIGGQYFTSKGPSGAQGDGVTLNGGTLDNFGAISGGNAVTFGNAAATLIVESGAVFAGKVVANAGVADVLEVSGASVTALGGIGTQFLSFNNIVFAPGAAWTIGGNVAGLASGQSIGGFYHGNTIKLTGIAAQSETFANNVMTLRDGGGTVVATLDLAEPGSVTGALFAVTNDGADTTIASSVPCFCAGTRLLTDRGEVAVERLAIGDCLVTRAGVARPIRWIGTRGYSGRVAAANRDVLPVLIRAGALGGGLPRRDLAVSPLHAMWIDGMLVPAGALVNGSSIAQMEDLARVDYFHVELDTHDVVLAEGAPSETYLDERNRDMFQNAAEYALACPDPLPPGAYCAPRVEGGLALAAIRRRLDRGGVQTVEIARAGRHVTRLRRGSNAARLVSVASRVPGDLRRLGAAVTSVRLDGVALTLEDRHLAIGWHAAEGQCRWTDGAGLLLLPPGAAMLEIEVTRLAA